MMYLIALFAAVALGDSCKYLNNACLPSWQVDYTADSKYAASCVAGSTDKNTCEGLKYGANNDKTCVFFSNPLTSGSNLCAPASYETYLNGIGMKNFDCNQKTAAGADECAKVDGCKFDSNVCIYPKFKDDTLACSAQTGKGEDACTGVDLSSAAGLALGIMSFLGFLLL